MKPIKRLLTLSMFFVIPALQAEDLISAYEKALENDPQLQAVKEQLNATREQKNLARARLLPSIGLGADYDAINSDIKSRFGEPPENDTNNYNERSLGLNLTQSVYNRASWIGLDQADSIIAQAEAQYAAAEIDLMVRTTIAYFDILAAKDDLLVANAQKEANGRQLEQAQQRFDVGLIAITDVHEAQAAFDNAQALVIAAENLVDNAWEALFEIIGPQPQGTLAKLAEELELKPPVPNNQEEWSDQAQQQNYDILASLSNLKALQQEIEVRRSGHYPIVDLVGGYNLNRTSNDFGVEADTGSIGLSLDLPLYTGGSVTSQTEQARANYRAAQQNLDQTRRAVNRQVRDAFRGILSTISQVNALKAATISAKSALDSTQAGYEVGTRTIVDVLNVQSNLFSAQRDYLQSRYDYILNGLSLKSAAGTLSKSDLELVNSWLEYN